MRLKCIVSYDGTNYSGFQRQQNQITIQGEIEKVLEKIHKKSVPIHASGRTDAKVHAYGQVFHFDSNLQIPNSNWKRALNSLLPDDIYIKDVEVVSDDFHSRFSAIGKEYHYKIMLNEYNPLKKNYYCYVKELNIDKMIEASKHLLGSHDFRSFSGNTEPVNYIRTIYNIEFEPSDDILIIKFTGKSFLRYMIRIIVGTLIEVGTGKKQVEDIQNILEKHDRRCAGFTAEPQGLYLYKLDY